MQVTYKQLMEELQKQFCTEANDSGVQRYRNHLTTLHSFLMSCGKSDESRIGHELKSGFNEALNLYLASINVSDRSKSDRRSHLNKWQILYAQMSDKSKAEKKPPLGRFNLALKQAMLDSNLSQANVLKSANVSKSVFSHWLRGASPNERSSASIHRVEHVLYVPRGTLADLVNDAGQYTSFTTPRKIEFRVRQTDLKMRPYRLLEGEISTSLISEWTNYFSYKTSTYVYLERARKGTWRLKPIDKNSLISPHANIGAMGSATADIVWQEMRGFLGFLRLPKLEGGFGLKLHEVQTIAWFAHL